MQTVVYDGSFQGWLTAVFEIYEKKCFDVDIIRNSQLQPKMFGDILQITADEKKVNRLLKGLLKKVSPVTINKLHSGILSEIKGIENIMLEYVRHVFGNINSVENDYSNRYVLTIDEVSKQVRREKHRMEAFIRFQLTADGIYYAICEPDFNVLPLIEDHFMKRYADQRWLIYDAKRKYGLYYDLVKVDSVELSFSDNLESGKDISNVYDSKESLYQQLWQQYFKSVNIASRKNMKLHVQHMPKRYWKYLPEKQ